MRVEYVRSQDNVADAPSRCSNRRLFIEACQHLGVTPTAVIAAPSQLQEGRTLWFQPKLWQIKRMVEVLAEAEDAQLVAVVPRWRAAVWWPRVQRMTVRSWEPPPEILQQRSHWRTDVRLLRSCKSTTSRQGRDCTQ